MDSVISKLSEIEVAASRIMDGAANQKKLLDQDQEKRIEEYDAQMDQKTEEEISRLRQELSSSRDKELQKLEQRSQEALQALEAYYHENHAALAQQIYEKIVRK